VRCFYHRDYYFPLPESHPFPMDKFWRAEAMIRASAPAGLRILDAAPAPFDDLLRVHTAAYLEKIRRAELGSVEALKLGLPAGEALLERSRLETGGTLLATEAALSDGLAANLAGGTHHAHADRGLGYCVLNDVAVAIRVAQARLPGLRISVIDTDAHHGDGTAHLFSADPDVFTYSVHVGRNYPSIKPPGSLDVPLPRWVRGVDYLDQLESTLPQALDEHRPGLAFWIGGADPHEHDRFGQMRLTDADMAARDAFVLDQLVRRRGVPTVVLYGGGYNRDREHTARLHARAILAAASL
jgi:Deacetylases, including yeast histone deacetylase and acetoin utilization protein